MLAFTLLCRAPASEGAHVRIPFWQPPTVLLGARRQVECTVQQFTSSKNRLHCIISAKNAPSPTAEYNAGGTFVSLPLTLYKNGKAGDCWHVFGLNSGCVVRFDVGGTARVLRVLTRTVESGGLLRLSGEGIDGGLTGAPRFAGALFRGATPVLGACGEKDCQASNVGAETLSCYSRPDAGGDGVGGSTQASQLAVAHSNLTRFGCTLDALAGGTAGGHFNLSLHAISDDQHRGDAFLGFLATRMLDVASGTPFDAELPPRITSVKPRVGSLAGGTELTITGSGFGANPAALSIEVGHLACTVTQLTTTGAICRLASHPAATAPVRPTPTATIGSLGSFPGERGVRWQWGGGTPGSLLLPSFSAPMGCADGCSSGWKEQNGHGTPQVLEGWFEAPLTATYVFMVRTDVTSSLQWSSNETAEIRETLAYIGPKYATPPPFPPPPPSTPPVPSLPPGAPPSPPPAPWGCDNKPTYVGTDCPNYCARARVEPARVEWCALACADGSRLCLRCPQTVATVGATV